MAKRKRKKIAFITGITGQDGSYLAKHLLLNNYEVHGLIRRSSVDNTYRLKDYFKIKDDVTLHVGDLNEHDRVRTILHTVSPDEIYNLGAMSFVGTSFAIPLETAKVNGLSVINILNYIRDSNAECRFYQASTSEMFGNHLCPQNENTPFKPRSPYGSAKAFAHHMCVNYREAYDLHISCGILFNHESHLRGDEFVTKKITNGLKTIVSEWRHSSKHYSFDPCPTKFVLELGNVDARRDWGHAADYVEAMHLMLQQDKGDDYVVATGKNYSVRDFLEQGVLWIHERYPEFPVVSWKGCGEDFTGSFYTADADSGHTIIKVNPKFYRPSEVNYLLGDPTKAKEKLGWEPRHSLEDIVSDMMTYD